VDEDAADMLERRFVGQRIDKLDQFLVDMVDWTFLPEVPWAFSRLKVL